MSSDSRRALGNEGETRAAEHLAARGYRIVARNVRADRVEIDLVVERGGTLAFVEVKTRASTRHGAPALAVDARKQRRILRGAGAWMRTQRVRPRRIRFDVVSCWRADDGSWRIDHWPGAFDGS